MMSKEKEQRVKELDPNRTKVAQSMVTHAGAPLMNNPQNAISDPQSSSFSGINQSPYGDIGRENPPQMGGVYATQPSGLQQSATLGQGFNSMQPYGMQNQPPTEAFYPFEAQQLNMRNESAEQTMMGMTGREATVAPGALPSQMSEQTQMTLPLQGMPDAQRAVSGMNTKTGKR